ncbi:MAG: hypothetical protein PHW04_11465 [Candidatus Wallbacteria bacterium]|nr:hypothetical protein [Candidatus Wallbacteria bacterium]
MAVPTSRSLGYDDSYGDRSPIPRLKELANQNDDSHPILVVLAHDGDNAGCSGSRYYFETLNWIGSDPDNYQLTTIQDYLDMYPPGSSDLIHVEDGAWPGADIGDPEFKKWNGDPYYNGTVDPAKGKSSDRNSWAAVVAMENKVHTHAASGFLSSSVENAWRYLMEGQTSCYWYWDGKDEWDDKPTLACNLSYNALGAASPSGESTPPTIFPPQREPYNPGGMEWGTEMTRDFTVWTLVYDVSGLKSVKLFYQTTGDTIGSGDLVYNNGSEWNSLDMTLQDLPLCGKAIPKIRAGYYLAKIMNLKNKMVNYYVEAADTLGNTGRSAIFHVYVGNMGDTVSIWEPENPTATDKIRIWSAKPGALHWGVNGWKLPDKKYWTSDTTAWTDGKAVETKMTASGGKYLAEIGPFTDGVTEVDFVFHYDGNTWDKDHLIYIATKSSRIVPLKTKPTLSTAENRFDVFRARILRSIDPVSELSEVQKSGSREEKEFARVVRRELLELKRNK